MQIEDSYSQKTFRRYMFQALTEDRPIDWTGIPHLALANLPTPTKLLVKAYTCFSSRFQLDSHYLTQYQLDQLPQLTKPPIIFSNMMQARNHFACLMLTHEREGNSTANHLT